MRIALVTQHSPLEPAADTTAEAPAARVAEISRSLAQLGHRITIYARKDAASLPGQAILAPGVTVEHVQAGPPNPLPDDQLARHAGQFAGHLSRRWQARPPELAHGYSWIAGLAALAGARGLPVPVAQTFESLGQSERRSGAVTTVPAARIRLEACVARAAAVVFASSSEEAAELVRLGVPKSAICMVPCGVDTASFKPARMMPCPGRRRRLVAVSPLHGRHGLDTVIRAVAEVPDAELTIAGGPPRSQLRRDRDYLQLSGLARKLGVRNRVTFAGRTGQQDLVDLLRSADLLVSASPYEPSGMTAIQAMACGTPVVVSAVGSHRDAVIDGTTGMLVPPGQPRVLAGRLRRLLASPALLEAYGIAAADRARSRYSWDRIGRETLAAYERVLRPLPPMPTRAALRATEVAPA